ncbi:hypothetical protein U6A24_13620 [Aquimarina gracilis]|uniref:Uncharacterized protein n=1 Tax=Aquimarina gracilis TaxID=874422 RepID=A0ABU5ZXB3_9FLAO|nr:hypothetical protein [Aquimarina gracilis]MEB3346511.1 hypothetical protein [Aquimarina gracilis]
MRKYSYFLKLGKGTYGVGGSEVTTESLCVNEISYEDEIYELNNKNSLLERKQKNLYDTVFYNLVFFTRDLLEDYSNNSTYNTELIYISSYNNEKGQTFYRLLVDKTKINIDFNGCSIFLKAIEIEEGAMLAPIRRGDASKAEALPIEGVRTSRDAGHLQSQSRASISTNYNQFRVIDGAQPAYGNYIAYDLEYTLYLYGSRATYIPNNTSFYLNYQRESVNRIEKIVGGNFYQLTSLDNGKTLFIDNAVNDFEIDVTSSEFTSGTDVDILQLGSGKVTFKGSDLVSVHIPEGTSNQIAGPNHQVKVFKTKDNEVHVTGSLTTIATDGIDIKGAITLEETSPNSVVKVWSGTEQQYNALRPKKEDVLYFIVEEVIPPEPPMTV